MNTRLLTALGSLLLLAVAGCSTSRDDGWVTSDAGRSHSSLVNRHPSQAVASCCAERRSSDEGWVMSDAGRSQPSAHPSPEALLATPLLPPPTRPVLALDHRVATQDGTLTTLERLLDRPAAVSFAYTRCTNPNKCPRVVSAMGALRDELERAGLLGRVRLLVISYDPEHDSPIELRSFAKANGLRLDDRALFLQPECDPQHRLFRDLGVAAAFNEHGVAIHGIQLLLLDKQGRLARSFHTILWDQQQVLADLAQLAAE